MEMRKQDIPRAINQPAQKGNTQEKKKKKSYKRSSTRITSPLDLWLTSYNIFITFYFLSPKQPWHKYQNAQPYNHSLTNLMRRLGILDSSLM